MSNNLRLTILDVETTGADPVEDHIIEVAIVHCTLENPEVLVYESLVRPGKKISNGAFNVHGISDSDVARAKDWKMIGPAIARLLERTDVLIGHNLRGFDAVILAHEFARHGIACSAKPTILDTMTDGRWATADGKVPRLEELAWALNVPYDRSLAHAALYDTRVTRDCVFEGVRIGAFTLPQPEFQ